MVQAMRPVEFRGREGTLGYHEAGLVDFQKGEGVSGREKLREQRHGGRLRTDWTRNNEMGPCWVISKTERGRLKRPRACVFRRTRSQS